MFVVVLGGLKHGLDEVPVVLRPGYHVLVRNGGERRSRVPADCAVSALEGNPISRARTVDLGRICPIVVLHHVDGALGDSIEVWIRSAHAHLLCAVCHHFCTRMRRGRTGHAEGTEKSRPVEVFVLWHARVTRRGTYIA